MNRILDLLEPEEWIGRHWHRLARGRSSMRRHSEAAASYEDVSGALPVFFRGLGGEPGARFAVADAMTSNHRLSLGLRIMLGKERLFQACRDDKSIFLPAQIDAFADRILNQRLYFWLSAFFVHMRPKPPMIGDPLAQDLEFLRRARLAGETVLCAAPGLRDAHKAFCAHLVAARPMRNLPRVEAGVERAILRLLDGDSDGGEFWPLVETFQGWEALRAPRGYRPFLPVPLWGESLGFVSAATPPAADEDLPPPQSSGGNEKSKRARRQAADQAERKDYLALNRFEKLLTLVESLNINRAVEDDDEDAARRALEESEELSLSAHKRKAATRLRVDIDIGSCQPSFETLCDASTYPEWDFRSRTLRPNQCRVISGPASENGDLSAPDAGRSARIARVRRHFEALRLHPDVMRGQVDGDDLDLDAVIRARADLISTGMGSDRLYLSTQRRKRDIAFAVLADTSLSTDAWLKDQRVLDVVKEALLMLTHALDACGDTHAIFTFTSRGRQAVQVATVKDFDEPLSDMVQRRICSLRPGHYTRMGAAIRHGAARLEGLTNRQKLLLIITDGKPNDIDHYEGRFGVEDTRHAIMEARRKGLLVFGVTVDSKAQDYFPVLFGRGDYAVVGMPDRLPAACLSLYQRLTYHHAA